MKTVSSLLLSFSVVLLFPVSQALAQGTAFTYQGRLLDGGAPANGTYDVEFGLFGTNVAGARVGMPVTNSATLVSNGLFTAVVDFGPGVFSGASYWLDVSVRTNGGGDFMELSPRQQITAAPYATIAASASNLLGVLPAAQLSGSISNSNFPANPIFSGTVSGGAFSGSGAQLTLLNGTNVASGTIADGRLSANVDLLSANQTVTGVKYFTNNIGFGSSSPDRPLTVQSRTGLVEWVSLKDSAGKTVWHLNNINGGVNFAQTSVQDFRLFLGTNGNVGIGESNPVAKLDVAGTISTTGGGVSAGGPVSASGNLVANNGNVIFGTNGSYFATSGSEVLRIVRGTVDSAGNITAGSGFSVQLFGTGSFGITYNQAFSGAPSVTMTPALANRLIGGSGNSGGFGAVISDLSGNASATSFSFIAIGPP